MKKSIKIVSILMIALMLVMVATPVFAQTTPKDIESKITEGNTEGIKNIGGNILGIIRVVGTIVAVGALLILGVKYMMGSVEEKAEYKKAFMPYILGAILLFAAVNLADMIFQWAQNLGNAV